MHSPSKAKHPMIHIVSESQTLDLNNITLPFLDEGVIVGLGKASEKVVVVCVFVHERHHVPGCGAHRNSCQILLSSQLLHQLGLPLKNLL